jgi:hypothetical protein
LKAFFLLLVFAAAGLTGVLYWRRSLHAPSAPVAAGPAEPTKQGKQRRRRRRGVRRMARNEVVASAPSGEAPAPSGEAPIAEETSPSYAPPREEPAPAPLAPGGSATTEAAPEDIFGTSSSPAKIPSEAQRQPAQAEPEPIKLRPADLKLVWQGEDLSRAENQTLDFSKDTIGHELSQDEIDARFRTKESAVIGCVTRAHPDAYTYVPGHVTVRFRIQRTGAVKGVQVEAPVILHKGGVTGCIKGVVGGLRFPASDRSQVISYPFSLM